MEKWCIGQKTETPFSRELRGAPKEEQILQKKKKYGYKRRKISWNRLESVDQRGNVQHQKNLYENN